MIKLKKLRGKANYPKHNSKIVARCGNNGWATWEIGIVNLKDCVLVTTRCECCGKQDKIDIGAITEWQYLEMPGDYIYFNSEGNYCSVPLEHVRD